jgi:hypothetical protein
MGLIETSNSKLINLKTMLLYWGTGFRGAILTNDDRLIETKFFHIWLLPLIPLGGAERIGKEHYEASFNVFSMFLGYARTYLGLASIFFCIQGFSEDGSALNALSWVACWLASLLVLGKGYKALGRFLGT